MQTPTLQIHRTSENVVETTILGSMSLAHLNSSPVGFQGTLLPVLIRVILENRFENDDHSTVELAALGF